MRMSQIILLLVTVCLLAVGIVSGSEVPQLITVQGLLTNSGGSPLPNAEYSVVFSIYDVPSGGSALWNESRLVGTTDGIFTILIGSDTPIPGSIFWINTLFLGIRIESDPEMTPRQRLVTSPYSFHTKHADTAAYAITAGSAGGWVDAGGSVRLMNIDDSVGVGTSTPRYELDVVGKAISGDNCTAAGAFATVSGGQSNSASGERSVVAGGHGNTASQGRATVSGGYNNTASGTESVVSGGQNNIASGIRSCIVGGDLNIAGGDYSFIGGGWKDTTSQEHATVVGGYGNHAGGIYSTVGGGYGNQAMSGICTIAGGDYNLADNSYATVGGGSGNHATGQYSTIPGGYHNQATEYGSFAAGLEANSVHEGALVLSCFSYGAPFESIANNEFAVRALGGVRFVTGEGPSTGVQVAAGGGSWSSLSDRNAKENFAAIELDNLLNELLALDICTWNYRTQDESIRHVGPVAQDFYAAFGVGEDERRITSIDADGVALAAIQALANRQQKQLTELRDEIAQLKALLTEVLTGEEEE